MDSSKTIVEICKEQVKLQAISEKLSKCLEKTKHYGNFIAVRKFSSKIQEFLNNFKYFRLNQ